MRTRILLAALATLPVMAMSQTAAVDVEWGDLYKSQSVRSMSKIMGYDETGYYTIQSKLFFGPGLFEKFDTKLKKVASAEIDLKAHGMKRRMAEGTFYFGDKLLLMTSWKNKKVKQNQLYIELIDKKKMTSTKDAPILLTGIDYRWGFNRGGFDNRVSNDASKLMVYYVLPYERGANQKYGFNVFDNELNKLYDQQIELPYPQEQFILEQVRVGNDGSAYFIGFVYDNKPPVIQLKAKTALGKYHAFRVDKAGNVTDFELTVPGKYVTDITINVDDENNLVCAGYFADKEVYGWTGDVFAKAGGPVLKGAFYAKFSGETQEVLFSSDFEFSVELRKKGMTKGEAKREDKKEEKGRESTALRSFSLQDLIVDEEGNIFLVGEQVWYEKVVDKKLNGEVEEKEYYHYDDIIVSKLSPEGEFMWSERILKRQASRDDEGYYSSFVAHAKAGAIYLVYNDNVKNYDPDRKEWDVAPSGFTRKLMGPNLDTDVSSLARGTQVPRKNLVASVAYISPDGQLSKEMLFNSKEAGAMTVPQVSKRLVGTDKVLIYAKKGSKERLAVLTFNGGAPVAEE